jgi:hypothetical protein
MVRGTDAQRVIPTETQSKVLVRRRNDCRYVDAEVSNFAHRRRAPSETMGVPQTEA